jgi:hypothetical protein
MGQINNATARKACMMQEKMLADVAGGAYPPIVDPNTYGLTQAVNASVAVPGIGTIDTDKLKDKPIENGAQRIEVRYMVKRCNDSQEPNLNPCTDGENGLNPWKYAYPTMSAPVYHEFTIDMGAFRGLCEGRPEHVRMLMGEAYESIMRQMNARFASQIIANLGNYFHPSDCTLAVDSAAAPYTLNMFDTNMNPNPMGLFPLFQQYKRMGIGERPFVVGGDHLDAWNFSRSIFAGNTEGHDPNKVRNDRAFSDYQIDQEFGDGSMHALSWVPGSLFPMNFWKYIGDWEHYSDDQSRKKFDLGKAVGAPSLMVDQSIAIVKCGEEIKLIYKHFLHTDLFFIPSDGFSEACYQCSNYILNWLTACGDLGCSTIFDQFAAPAEAP